LFSFHQFAFPFLGKQHQKSERQFVFFISSFFFSFSGKSYIRDQNANVDFSFQGIAARMLILFFHFREKQLTSEIASLVKVTGLNLLSVNCCCFVQKPS